MSKSKDNIINIFLPEKQLKKQVMSIQTDSTPLEEPKDPDSCNVFAIYSLLADTAQTDQMRKNYQGGGYGYGHAKKELLELILDRFSTERTSFEHYMNNLDEIDQALAIGAKKATLVADEVLGRVRAKLGY